jgi:hypothetical protein
MTTLRSQISKGCVLLSMIPSNRGPHNEEHWYKNFDLILNIPHSNFSHAFPRKRGPFHEIHSLNLHASEQQKFISIYPFHQDAFYISFFFIRVLCMRG